MNAIPQTLWRPLLRLPDSVHQKRLCKNFYFDAFLMLVSNNPASCAGDARENQNVPLGVLSVRSLPTAPGY